MKNVFAVPGAVLVAAALAASAAAPGHASTEVVRSSLAVLVDGFVFFNPCALDDRGEDVELSGTFDAEITTTIEDGRATRLTVNVDPSDASGHGLTSGASYRARPGATGVAESVPESPGHWRLQPVTLSPGDSAYQPPNGGWYETHFDAGVPDAPADSPAYLDLELETDKAGLANRLVLYRIVLDCRP